MTDSIEKDSGDDLSSKVQMKRDVLWLIGEAEEQISMIIEELQKPDLSISQKASSRRVLAALMNTLQRLYTQRNLQKPDEDDLASLFNKIPDALKKKVEEVLKCG